MPNESNRRTPRWTRWAPLVQTTPSGKVLFVCLVCGHSTPAPNNHCRPYAEREGRRSLDPKVLEAFPGVEDCSGIEDCINAEIEKNIEGHLVLDWAEDKLNHYMDRKCPYCFGYGCQVCIGRGKRS